MAFARVFVIAPSHASFSLPLGVARTNALLLPLHRIARLELPFSVAPCPSDSLLTPAPPALPWAPTRLPLQCTIRLLRSSSLESTALHWEPAPLGFTCAPFAWMKPESRQGAAGFGRFAICERLRAPRAFMRGVPSFKSVHRYGDFCCSTSSLSWGRQAPSLALPSCVCQSSSEIHALLFIFVWLEARALRFVFACLQVPLSSAAAFLRSATARKTRSMPPFPRLACGARSAKKRSRASART